MSHHSAHVHHRHGLTQDQIRRKLSDIVQTVADFEHLLAHARPPSSPCRIRGTGGPLPQHGRSHPRRHGERPRRQLRASDPGAWVLAYSLVAETMLEGAAAGRPIGS
jgi:hypothetical protein